MVEMGWDHDALNAMSEEEFNFWLDERIELDEARREAERKAAKKAKS